MEEWQNCRKDRRTGRPDRASCRATASPEAVRGRVSTKSRTAIANCSVRIFRFSAVLSMLPTWCTLGAGAFGGAFSTLRPFFLHFLQSFNFFLLHPPQFF